MKYSNRKQSLAVRNLLLLISVILLSFSSTIRVASAAQDPENYPVYMPMMFNEYSDSFVTQDKFLGIIMKQYWEPETIPYLPMADEVAGKQHSVVGWWINLIVEQPELTLKVQLDSLWQNGYVSFVNFSFDYSTYDIANGKYDYDIQRLAHEYAVWADLGEGRIAFLAPLPEMNGSWTPYYGSPTNFKLAYRHIQDIFAGQGVTPDQVWWVFAPNGGSEVGDEFEYYYPGDDYVDAVGFSSYNYGYCPNVYWKQWRTYDTLFEPYIRRMETMAPKKPIIVAQTGTTAQYQSSTETNVTAKNNWLIENYEYLAQQPSLLGVIYFDIDTKCVFRIIPDLTTYKPGYSTAAAQYKYLSSQDFKRIIP